MMTAEGLGDAHPVVDALRLQGAHRFDPVRFHYLEVLAQRASTHEGSVKRILDGKLEAAAAALRERMAQSSVVAQITAAPAETAQRETLGDLLRYMAEHAATHTQDKPGNRVATSFAPRAELKSVTYFRSTWSRLSAEKEVAKALELAPKNAGPINSHVVALRALALMRDTAPDYLNRFMTYVDTLLSLDQGEKAAVPTTKAPRAAKSKTKN
ncbi:MAG: DUF2894 domain-containing protein [Pseudomonadota bacterium]